MLVCRGVLESLNSLMETYTKDRKKKEVDAFEFKILRCLDHIIQDCSYPDNIRREASAIREKIIVLKIPSAQELLALVEKEECLLKEGQRFFIPESVVDNEDTLGRVLSLTSVKNFGLYAMAVKGGYEIIRGDRYRRKFWRILYEYKHPDPAKRQGFLHSVGRQLSGTIRAHPRLLAEITETKVPGERLYIPSENTWRSYLPTVDDLLSLCCVKLAGKPVRLFSPEGVLKITGPQKLLDRVMLWINISFGYDKLAKHRNVEAKRLTSHMARGLMQVAFEDLGISCSFHPHEYQYAGKLYSAIDPIVASNLYPAARHQMVQGVDVI